MWRICACRTATPQALLGRVHHVQVLSLHRRHELAVDEMPVEQSLHFFGPFLKFVDQIRNPIYFINLVPKTGFPGKLRLLLLP